MNVRVLGGSLFAVLMLLVIGVSSYQGMDLGHTVLRVSFTLGLMLVISGVRLLIESYSMHDKLRADALRREAYFRPEIPDAPTLRAKGHLRLVHSS